MKKLNVKAALVLSLLAFSACDKGGGGSNTPQVVGVPGVTLRQYSVVAGQNCNVNGDNTYTCNEYGRSSGNIGYNSLQNFCEVIMNEYTNQNVASITRQQMYREQCTGGQNNNNFCGNGAIMQNGVCVNNNNNFPGTINPGTGNVINDPNMKSVSCQLYVKKGNTTGDTGLMNVQVIQNNKNGVNIFAFTNASYNKKFLGFINVSGNKFSNSEKLAKVKMYYTKDAGKADMIKLEATGVDGELSASVTGFAGTETKLVIGSEDEYSDATRIEISCMSQGATTGNAQAYKAYRCKGEEKDGTKVTKIDYASPYNDDIMNQSYDLSKSAKLDTAGALATDSGTASYRQIARYGSDSSVSTQANITTPSSLSVARTNYRLNVECKPAL